VVGRHSRKVRAQIRNKPHHIFEKIIFAKVGLTLLIFNKVRAQRGANDLDAGKNHRLGEFVARDNLIGGREQAHRA